MKLPVQLFIWVLIVAVGFCSTYLYYHSKVQAELVAGRDAAERQLKASLRAELERVEDEKNKDLAEWDAKIAGEKAQADEVQKEWDNRGKVYNDNGQFLMPYKALRWVSASGFDTTTRPQGRVRTPTLSMVRFFNMTDQEIKAIEELIKATWKDLLPLERKNLTFVQDGDKLVINVKPYYDAEGKKLEERFYNGLRDIMGTDRYDAYREIEYFGPASRMFLRCGKVPYRITFKKWGEKYSPEYQDENGKWRGIVRFQMERFVSLKPEYFKKFNPKGDGY